MLYIDPVACVDCGACVSACPVGAIAPDARLEPEQLPFVALNASFYPDLPRRRKLPPTSKLAPVIPAPEVRARVRGPADGGHRRVRAGRHVRRRRTTHPARRAGQRLRKAAHPLRVGARRGRTGPPDHQAGHPAVRPDRPSPRIPVLPQRRGRQAPEPRRLAGAPPRRASTPSARPTTAGWTSTGWACLAPVPPPNWWPGSTVTPNSPICQSISATSGSSSSATATSPSTWPAC